MEGHFYRGVAFALLIEATAAFLIYLVWAAFR